MKLTIELNMDNDAFDYDPGAEASLIVRHAIDKHFHAMKSGDILNLRDTSGIPVGKIVVEGNPGDVESNL